MNNNAPDGWCHLLPAKTKESHKYSCGHALIYGASKMTGATNLASSACARIGAGLVTVLAEENISNIYRAILPAHIIVRDDLQWFDKRVTARLYGSGGLSIAPDFNSDMPTVLDADALKALPSSLSPKYVLTPHEGEFKQAFPHIEGTSIERALQASQQINAHVVLKGAETVIASPTGDYTVNVLDAPQLATAGTGDVLAGMVTGLIAQGMPIFEACCAAVWIHGGCAKSFGVGLVASDIPNKIPDVLKDVMSNKA